VCVGEWGGWQRSSADSIHWRRPASLLVSNQWRWPASRRLGQVLHSTAQQQTESRARPARLSRDIEWGRSSNVHPYDYWPHDESTVSEDDVIGPYPHKGTLMIINGKLPIPRVLLDRNCQVKPWCPGMLHYNNLTSQLYVVHASEAGSWGNIVSRWSLGWVTKKNKKPSSGYRPAR